MTTLDQELDSSLREIERRRKAKLAGAVAGLVLVVATLLGFTWLMYSSSSGTVSEDRIGEQVFE